MGEDAAKRIAREFLKWLYEESWGLAGEIKEVEAEADNLSVRIAAEIRRLTEQCESEARDAMAYADERQTLIERAETAEARVGEHEKQRAWIESRLTRLRRAAVGKPWRAIQCDGRFQAEEIASDRFATAREAIDAARPESADEPDHRSAVARARYPATQEELARVNRGLMPNPSVYKRNCVGSAGRCLRRVKPGATLCPQHGGPEVNS